MKTLFLMLLASLTIAVWGGTAAALPVTFSESFLGGQKDGIYMDIQQGSKASFGFNLVTPGDSAVLSNSQGNIINSWTPSTDSSGFVTGQYNLVDAKLNFTFSSLDAAREQVTIRAGVSDGSSILAEEVFTLGKVPLIRDSYLFRSSGSNWDRQCREYTDYSIDLLGLGMEKFLNDGRFKTLVLALDFGSYNDFRIDYANLTLNADPVSNVPVPEPGTWLLLGCGLLGIAGLRKRPLQK